MGEPSKVAFQQLQELELPSFCIGPSGWGDLLAALGRAATDVSGARLPGLDSTHRPAALPRTASKTFPCSTVPAADVEVTRPQQHLLHDLASLPREAQRGVARQAEPRDDRWGRSVTPDSSCCLPST